MGDLLFLAILVVFFALAIAFVRACDRIVGPDTEALAPVDTDDTAAARAEEAAA